MDAICKDSNGCKGNLTLNKLYKFIRESKFSSDFVLVINDNGKEQWFTKSRFRQIN